MTIQWGARIGQGYPVEIAGRACANDPISILVSGPGVGNDVIPPVAPGNVSVGQPNGSFDLHFYYAGQCGSGSIFFDVSTPGQVSPGVPRESDINWTRGISCLAPP
jgi:hypothetical protein